MSATIFHREAISRGVGELRWLLCLAVICGGCATVPVEPEAPTVSNRRYLVEPLLGYDAAIDASLAEELRQVHTLLVAGELRQAESAALALRRAGADSPPLQLLFAQIQVAGEEWELARRTVEPLLLPPEYAAAEVLAGRIAEQFGEVVDAYGFYRRAGESAPLGRRRAEELRKRALQTLVNRIRDDLKRRNLEEAGNSLERLNEWDPEDTLTLELTRRWAVAAERPEQELRALRGLAKLRLERPARRRRRAELEASIGDAGTAVQILQELRAANPADLELRSLLATARFRWRLDLLPLRVRSLAELPVLSRAQFAALLYWLAPQVRTLPEVRALIASDLLDHPLRRESVKVINLGLLDIHASLHHFRPNEPIRRSDAFTALLRLLARDAEETSCIKGAQFRGPISVETVCEFAASCGIVAEEAACLPGATISGPLAVELIARAIAAGEE